MAIQNINPKALLLGMLMVLPAGSWAAPGPLANEPLYSGNTVAPNVLFNLDDSGSMIWEITPDDIMGGGSVMYVYKPGSPSVVENTGYDYTALSGWLAKPSYTNNCGSFIAGTNNNETTHCIREYLYDNVATHLQGEWMAAFSRSPEINVTYYNPKVRYQPWVGADGTPFDNSEIDAALNRPGFDDAGVRDLTDYNEERANYCTDNNGAFGRACGGKLLNSGSGHYQQTQRYWPAIYYNFNGSDISSDSQLRTWANYTPVIIAPQSKRPVSLANNSGGTTTYSDPKHYVYPKYEARTDCAADPCTYEEEIQNFANWYSYARSRILASRGAIGRAFVAQPDTLRVGYTAINAESVLMGVRAFSGDNKADFYDNLYETNIGGATPLRKSMDIVGQYFLDASAKGQADPSGPWADDPVNGVLGEDLSCRPNFHILMTDGYWNEGSTHQAGTEGARQNVDGSDGPVHTRPGGGTFQYKAVSPFSDNRSNTLADAAMYYWVNDLRPHSTVPNNVPELGNSPAFWQHLVTIGVGLGVQGSLDPDTVFSAVGDEDSTIVWPNPVGSNSGKIDDLLHAAVNTYGQFFSAADPVSFATELSDVLNRLVEIVGSSSGVTFNTSTLETDTLVFGASFNSARWSGEIAASRVQEVPGSAPTVESVPAWEAGKRLNERNLNTNPRQIITLGASGGVGFDWDNLTASQRADLSFGGIGEEGGRARIDFLRGHSVDGMRARDGRLGDIVHSTPVYVQKPSQRIPNADPFGSSTRRYAEFRAEKESRAPMVYVGSNGGMLHGFSAETESGEGGGREVFGYVPGFVYSNQANQGLHYLTNPAYLHRYYVDLTPAVADVYINGANAAQRDWRTILIGGGRTGAKGIFALDITNPELISEGAASQLALWEFTSDHDARMGYITEPPIIAMARWGNNDYRWSAIFGNGYNSTQKASGIFVLDIESGVNNAWSEQTGQTGQGNYRFISVDTSTTATGLSPVRALDLTGNNIIDRVYAGDLKGQMWTLQSNSNGRWENPNGTAPLFAASQGGSAQPITAAPMVIRNTVDPSGNAPNLMVIFGTGQYLVGSDPSSTSTQTLYAVYDQGNYNLGRTNLRSRDLVESNLVVEGETYEVREASGDDVGDRFGWYADLTESGERIIQSPQVRGRYIFVNSMVPSDDPCTAGGGGGWLMAFGLDGRTPDRAVLTRFGEPVVGYRTGGGFPNRSAFLGDFMLTPRSDGAILTDVVDVGGDEDGLGRLSWQEIYD